VAGYVAHRWSKAGGSSVPPFEQEAIRKVALYSQGVPRLVNAICDNALVMAYGDGAREIRASMVQEAARDLDLVNGDHQEALNGNGPSSGELKDLDLLVSASAIAASGIAANLERQPGPRKESWLVRSTRKLLRAKAAEA